MASARSPARVSTHRRHGGRVALSFFDATSRTYAELEGRSDQLAAGLRSLGLSFGDRACVFMANSAAFLETWFALAKLGVLDDWLQGVVLVAGC